MTMLEYPVSYGGFTGTAYQHDHAWWVSPAAICDFLGLAWRVQRRVIQDSETLSSGTLKVRVGDGKMRETVMLPTADIGVWLASISPSKVNAEARPMLIDMQRRMRDAIEAQINNAFGLPSVGDFDTLMNAPIPAGLDPAGVIAERATILSEPGVLRSALLFRMGLPGTKVALFAGRTPYWARKRRRFLEIFGMVEPRRAIVAVPANDPNEPDLFAAPTGGENGNG